MIPVTTCGCQWINWHNALRQSQISSSSTLLLSIANVLLHCFLESKGCSLHTLCLEHSSLDDLSATL